MGTRGAYGFRVDGKDYISYNHFDSYPSGLGVDILAQAKSLIARKGGIEALKKQVRKIRLVTNATPPTPEDIKRCEPFTDLSVSERSTSDWYCLLRKAQGRLDALVRCGVMMDSSAFLTDSLFCEYAYIINLDDGTLEFYMGFNEGSLRNGKVVLVTTFKLNRFPGERWFLRKCETMENKHRDEREKLEAA